jgi:hypothetical protein
MGGIPVTVGPPTAEGRLYPRYMNSIKILVLESGLPRSCPHGVNIDSRLILDFDESRRLAGVELLAGMSGWRGSLAVTQPSARPGDICLGEELSGSADFDWPVTVSKDVQRDMARISFDEGDFDRAVALSDSAAALLRADRLIGFWFSFAP